MNKKFVQKVKYGFEEKVRLDNFVVTAFQINRSQAQRQISEGLILVNEGTQKPRYIVQKGDEVSLYKEIPTEKRVKIPSIFEDKDIIVINKPAGISTHPADGERGLTVFDLLKDKLDFPTFEDREGIVHRLDKGTSGVMILAKNGKSQEILQSDFKNRKITKTYVALIEGHLEPKAGIIDMPIARDEKHREKMTVAKGGKDAVTQFATINIYDRYSLLKLNPKTGRTHQLRVHLSALNHPIVGDLRYGKKSGLTDRIFLHAEKLEFTHPVTGRKLSFEAELPKELEKVLIELEK